MRIGKTFAMGSLLLLFTTFGKIGVEERQFQPYKSGLPGSQIKLLSWNIYGIFDSPLQQLRAAEIVRSLKDYDIVLLQEAWCMNVQVDEDVAEMIRLPGFTGFNSYETFSNYLYHETSLHQMNYWFDVNKGDLARKGTDSGIGIVSRYPIKAMETLVFEDGYSQDLLANKGVAYAQIHVIRGEKPYKVHVFATHNNAVYNFSNPTKTEENTAVQKKQTKQIHDFIARMSVTHNFSLEKDAVVVAGDFNVNYKMINDTYKQLEELNLKPMWDAGNTFNKDKCPSREFTGLYVWKRDGDGLSSFYSPQQQKEVEATKTSPARPENSVFEETFGGCFSNGEVKWWESDVEITRDYNGTDHPACPQWEVPESCPCCACTKYECLEFAAWDLQFFSNAIKQNKTFSVEIDREVAKWNVVPDPKDPVWPESKAQTGIHYTLSDHWPLLATWTIPDSDDLLEVTEADLDSVHLEAADRANLEAHQAAIVDKLANPNNSWSVLSTTLLFTVLSMQVGF